MATWINWLRQAAQGRIFPLLLGASLLLVTLAAVLVLLWDNQGSARPPVATLRPDEEEIAWLYPATNTAAWERLVQAVAQTRERLHAQYPGLSWEQRSMPSGSSLPSLSLVWPEGRRLVIRWYKLTSQWSPATWIAALLQRDRPPLAVVGGSTSYWARELGSHLQHHTQSVAANRRPLLLLTTATADRVPQGRLEGNRYLESISNPSPDQPALTNLYPGRTFRFCFSNRQMASVITRFLWTQPSLRPDHDPPFLVQYTDDAYSRDLCQAFFPVLADRVADNALQQFGWVSGAVGLGLPPAALAGWCTSGLRKEIVMRLDVDSSVGTFAAPNPYEVKVVRSLLAVLQPQDPTKAPNPLPKRPLLIVAGQAQPVRRLLRELARSAPETARQFVVATGDALPFNTIYRDRQVSWPIQDLPFTLVFFAHRNPVDGEAGFRGDLQAPSNPRSSCSGTEDVLLFRDLIEATALALAGADSPVDADGLARGLRAVTYEEDRLSLGNSRGIALLDDEGNRNSGTGEHVVVLQPLFRDKRVLPRAYLEVYAHQRGRAFRHVCPALVVSWDEFEESDVDRNPR